MNAAGMVVCEKGNSWAVALRRQLRPSGFRLVETRTLPDCLHELQTAPGALAVCEVTEKNVAAVLQFLVKLEAESPATRAVVVGTRATSRFEQVLREAGAIHAAFSPRELAGVARMAKRHAARRTEQAQSLEQLAWSRLPWQ
jgi:ActR/RegA family two-component response regulator